MSSDEDDFAFYGNALDPIDEDSLPKKKPMTVEDQYAKDDRGRRRFHGAFTGGFSAGFYNSVGSVEGWRPANFVSSRTNRTHSKVQSIFDFMDEEDTGEHGICPMSLQVKPTFDAKTSKIDSSNSKKRNRIAANEQHNIFDTSFVRDMLAPTRDTVGVKLLVKMGWRPGQGVGPRISKKEKKLHKRQRQRQTGDGKKAYGCRLPTDSINRESGNDSQASSSEPEFEGDLDNLTFAPNDYQAYFINPKQNAFGLGYRGIDRKPVLSAERPELSVLTVAGKSIRGQAFGVSVFEDDDEDIYNTEDMSNYDFSLPYVGEAKCAQRKTKSPTKNTNCIEGFYVSTTAISKTRPPFVLPSIPKDFQPLRVKKNRWDCTVNVKNHDKVRISDALERSKLLCGDQKVGDGEVVNTSCVDSIRVSDIPLPDLTSSQQNQVQGGSTENATFNVGCVRPFAYDEQKQYRFEKFLKLKNSSQFSEMSHIYPASMTEWEKEREKCEFEQAARLYRPLADDLASRFTRGSQKEDVHDISAPVERSYDTEFEVLRNAAKNKMYGVLTRKKYVWKPDKVICKRFNIPEPFLDEKGNTSECVSKTRDGKASIFEFLKMSTCNTNVSRITDTRTSPHSKSPSPSTRPALNHQTEDNVTDHPSMEKTNANAGDDELENDEQMEHITDKIDLFKAIFLTSSDDESEEEAKRHDEDQINRREKSETTTAYPTSQRERTETTATTQLRNSKREIRYSPARGIFANLDLESLKCKPSFRKNELSEESTVTTTNAQVDDSPSEAIANAALLYGPKIPNSLLFKTTTDYGENAQRFQRRQSDDTTKISSQQQSCHSSSTVWVEKSEKHRNKKHKKHHKKQKKSKGKKRK